MTTDDAGGLPPAGWYPDPAGPGRRWWDGSAWTDRSEPAEQHGPAGEWRFVTDDRPQVTGMGGAIRTVLGRYAQFRGRSGRAEFWFWTLFAALIAVAAGIATLALDVAAVAVGNAFAFLGMIVLVVLVGAWSLAIIVPTLAVTVRRLRDGGFHWAFLFLQLVPGGGLVILILCCMPSRQSLQM